jgi:hypothetical protein
MSDFANRCWGCNHYDGFDSHRGADTIVNCMLGYKNVTISSGCSSFEPDRTANCDNCYFYTTKKDGNFNKPHCKVHNITSMISTNFPGDDGYCQEFYHKDTVSTSREESKSGCFIATAVYNSPTAPKVMVLREFRDDTLLKYSFGKSFVKTYYKYSPKIADFISKYDLLRKLVRYSFVEPLIYIINKMKK